MALTIAYDVPRTHRITPDLMIVTGTIAFDSSYPTGGEELDLSPSKFTTLKLVLISNRLGYVFEYDYTNEKVKAFRPYITVANGSIATNTEIGLELDADDSFLVKASAADKSGITGCMLEEVTATTDLSSLTGVRFLAMGVV